MKLNRELLIGLGLLGSLAALIFTLNRAKQPDAVILEMTRDSPISEEHQLVAQALNAPQFILHDEVLSAEGAPAVEAPLPVLGQPLPMAWESQPAMTLGEVEQSPEVQRTLASVEVLRASDYTNPESGLNHAVVELLREKRHQTVKDY